MNRRPYRTSAAVGGAVAIALLGVAVPSQAATPGLAPVRGNTPSWATPGALHGHPRSDQTLTVRVGLAPRDAAGAATYAAAVSDPHNTSYGKYLSPSAYSARFGPSASAVTQVRNYLTGAGLSDVTASTSQQAVTARGTVAQLQKAFHTTLGLYTHGSQVLRAPSTPAQLPASIAPLVLSVGGLTDSPGAIHPNIKSANGTLKPAALATPCSQYYGQNHLTGLPAYDGSTSFPTANCGYTPQQLRGAYGLSATPTRADGAGVTVAIIDAYASPTMAADAQQYAANHGLPAFDPGQYREVPPSVPYYDGDPSICDAVGWTGEEALDVDAVHSMAPGANIVYVPSASCNDEDFLDAYDRILSPAGSDAPLATLVSNSYGDTSDLLPGDLQNQEHAYFVQAGIEGVGFYFSSGDDGDAAADNNGIPQPQASANDPAVTAVGGTTLGVNADNSYQFETGWGNDRTYLVQDQKTKQYSWAPSLTFYAGAGGGTSAVWAEPNYQKGVVPNSLANSLSGDKGPGRVVPDIAAVADPYTGFLEGYSTAGKKGTVYSEGSIGGTSLACPVIAGLMAVAQQRGGGAAIGFANPLLYSLGAGAFHDVSHPVTPDEARLVYYSPSASLTRLVVQDHDSSLATGPGYDDVTGRGSPSQTFITQLNAAR